MTMYQVEFLWKKGNSKKIIHSSSMYFFDSYIEADDYGSTLVFYERKKLGLTKTKNDYVIFDYSVCEVHSGCSDELIRDMKTEYLRLCKGGE